MFRKKNMVSSVWMRLPTFNISQHFRLAVQQNKLIRSSLCALVYYIGVHQPKSNANGRYYLNLQLNFSDTFQ